MRHALGDYQGPIIINRETAIPNNPGFWDAKNQQGKRVEIEMKAVHLLNAKMADSSQFIHIQNLSVNRHSENLGYDTQGTLKEATVMAEMAMIANLHQQVITGRLVDQRGAIVRAYNDVLGIYKNFLTDEKTGLSDAVFSTSDYFNSIKNRLIQAKKVFKKLNAQPESTNTKVLANQALLQIFAHDLHLDHKNGMFIQSLATFAQEGTIAGCKSANERFSSVEGRALLLRLITPRNSRLVNAKKDMTIAIQAFIANPDLANFASAQKKMNKGVNQYTVQARPNGVMSLLDQGGAAKIKVFLKKYWDCLKNIFSGANFNTNRAESPGITRLKTSNTSAMQAHKGNHAKDLKKVLAAKKGEIKTRKFEPDAKISLCLNFLKSELNRLENKVFSSWCNDKRIEFLMALIKKINNPYSIIEGAELVAHMKVIFKEGTQSRNNYDIFMSSQFPTLVADDGLDCCVARATLLSKDDKGVGKEIAITREEVFARPTKADAFVVNENPSPMMVNEDVVTRVTDFEDGVRPSIAIKIGSEGDLERDTFRESTADRLRFSTKAEKPPVLAIVGAEGSIEANDNMYQKAKYAVYSLCSKTVVVGALGTVLALASKAIG